MGSTARFGASRVAAVLFSLSLGVGAFACDKEGAEEVEAPGGGGGVPTAKKGQTVLSYAVKPFKLEEHLKAGLTVGGDAKIDLKADVVGIVDVKPEGTDHLFVTATVSQVNAFTAVGEGFDPDKTEDQYKEEIKGGKALSVTDLLGDDDKEKTDAIPENAKKIAEAQARRDEAEKKAEEKEAAEKEGKEAPAEGEGEGEGEEEGPKREAGPIPVAEFLGLPNLPKIGLELGKQVKLERQAEDRHLFGMLEVPVEVDYSYTLQSIEEVDGKKLATVDILIESGGAEDIDANGQTAFVSTLEETDITLVFDMTAQLPVSVKGYQASEISIEFGGNEQKIEQNMDIDSTYTSL
jgi:hypothetical protein